MLRILVSAQRFSPSLRAMAPKDTLWTLEPHSLGKHHILQRYLQAWLPIMTTRNGRVVIVDGFAGPGRYLGGEPGSPVVMLEAYLNHSYRSRMTAEIVYLFIEEREDRVEHLRVEVANLALPPNVVVEIVHGAYQNVLRTNLAELREAGRTLAPTFMFVDPFGYSDAPMTLTGDFLSFEHCEVLIYMPLPWVVRFVDRAGQDDAMNTLFGSDRWHGARDVHGAERKTFLHDLFRVQLLAHGSRYVRSFEIRAGGSGGYHLFFGTSHLLGLEKMKEAMWSLDRLAGQSYSDSTDSGQLVLFGTEPDTTPLLNDLVAHFGRRPFAVEEAEHFTLVATAFAKGHLRRRTLAPAEKAGHLEVLTARKQAGSFPTGTRMRFTN